VYLLNQSFAEVAVGRKKKYALPWRSFVPLRVIRATCAPLERP